MRRPEVIHATGLSKTRLTVLEQRGEFPERVRITEQAVGWRSDEVDEWIRNRPRVSESASKDPISSQASTAGRRSAEKRRAAAADQA